MSTQAWPHDRRVVSRASAFLAAAVYVTVAVMGRGLPAGELFPFFAWDLFSRVPGDTLRAAVYIEAVAGAPLAVPEELLGSARARGSKIVASQLTNELLRSVRSGSPDESVATALVANHLPADVEWTLRVESYDPIDRYRLGRVATVAVQRFIGEVPVADPSWISPDGRRIVSGSASWTLTDDQDGGQLEETRIAVDGTVHVSGWAADTATGLLPIRVLVLHGDEVLGTATAGFPRRDIRQASGTVALLAAGFSGAVHPRHPLELDRVGAVALYPDGTARRLP